MPALLALVVSLAVAADSYGLGAEPAGPVVGSIGGVVVNGSQRERALPGAEVVIRAAQNNELAPIGTTTCDEHGQFLIKDLPVLPGVEYLVGANHQGVHYPGPRVMFQPDDLAPRVRLIVYDALTGTNPLLIQRHEITIHATERVLEVTERLVIANLLRRGYVGEAVSAPAEAQQAESASTNDSPRDEPTPVTLRLTPFPGFLTVTFAQEFLGRNFRLENGQLVTSLPWPPGAREIVFSYQLPVENTSQVLRRSLDLPTEQLIVRRTGLATARLDGRRPPDGVPLQRVETSDISSGEESTAEPTEEAWSYQGAALPTGQILELAMSGLPVEPLHYAKWIALGVLVSLGVSTVVFVRRSQRPAGETEGVVSMASEEPRSERRRRQRAEARVRLRANRA